MNIMYTLLYASTYNVCFKKTCTNYSTVSLLCFVQVFLKQTLLSRRLRVPVIDLIKQIFYKMLGKKLGMQKQTNLHFAW